MHIRRLTPQDASPFRALRLSALHEEPTAFEGERLIGIVTLRREDKRKLRHKGMVYGLYVAPDARGQGVGRSLLVQALALAESVPELLQVNLSVNADNVAAIALYESLGFQTFGREPGAMRIDGVWHDELHMFWRPAR